MIVNELEIPYAVRVADSFWSRFKGLMFRKKPIESEGLWITPCNSIHMFFMSFAIDVVFLNEQNEVVKTYFELQPWKIIKPVKGAHSTLELPAGSIPLLEIEVGQKITWKE